MPDPRLIGGSQVNVKSGAGGERNNLARSGEEHEMTAEILDPGQIAFNLIPSINENEDGGADNMMEFDRNGSAVLNAL